MQLAQAPIEPVQVISQQVQAGDVIFIRVPFKPFREVADTTMSWTNHVGVVVSTRGGEPQVAESTFPLSRITPLSRFIARSEQDRVAVMRWRQPLTTAEQQRLHQAAHQRLGVFYDTGFDLHSRRQFCSKFVHQVVAEATGRRLGEVVSFRSLLADNPKVNLRFWRVWYFGAIPWTRQTISPASQLHSPLLFTVFDGRAVAVKPAPAPATR